MLYEIQRYKFPHGIIRVWVATTSSGDDFQRHAHALDHAWSRKQHAPPPMTTTATTTTQADDFRQWRNGGDDKRTCPQCGDVLPGDAHPNRRYCSAQCKQSARLERER